MAVRFALADDEPAREWSCEKCFDDPNSETVRMLRNCETDSNPNVAWAFAPSLRTCPVGTVTMESWSMLGWWQDWKLLGLLPYPGDMSEQPAFAVQALRICETTKITVERDRHKRQVREMEARAKGNG